jgi:uncharacterized protein YkwD
MNRIAAFATALVMLVPLAAAASSECVQLAFVNPHQPTVVSSEARLLVSDVNAARAQRGLPALSEDAKLSRFALEVAQKMAAQHYFGHTDPNGVTFQDRLRAAGYQNRYAAENMAFDQDERHAHAAFLRSPGHYANIIDQHPRKIGVAVVAAGDGEVFYVEEFGD